MVGDQVLGQKVTLGLGRGVEPGQIVVLPTRRSTPEHDILVKR